MIIATIYLVLVMYLILSVGWVLSQEKSAGIWTVMMATELEWRVNVIFSSLPLSLFFWGSLYLYTDEKI